MSIHDLQMGDKVTADTSDERFKDRELIVNQVVMPDRIEVMNEDGEIMPIHPQSVTRIQRGTVDWAKAALK